MVIATDYGAVVVKSTDMLRRAIRGAYERAEATRYDEYTGEPYTIFEDRLADNDMSHALIRYTGYISDLQAPVYIAGGDMAAVYPMLFDKWCRKNGIIF